MGGIFERYWVKPSKKKTSVEMQNPAKESMTRLGVCSMIIEPHVFEATLYVVKEPHPIHAQPKSHAPNPPPDMRYSSFSHVAIYPPAPRSMLAVEYPPNHTQTHANPPQPKSAPLRADFVPREPPVYHKSSPVSNNGFLSHGTHGVVGRSNTRDEVFHVQEDKPSSDPVIQMLATRAASNPDLKALMKVVASGDATEAELKDFQFHIDELNGTLKSRTKSAQDSGGQNLPSVSPFHERSSMNQQRISLPPLNIGSMPSLQGKHAHRVPPAENFKQEPHPSVFPQYAQPPKPKSNPLGRSDITGVVFDIGGAGDRYSFPKFSILEYCTGGTQVIASFLVARKGSEAASKGYKNNVSYYQPVTIRLSSLQPRILEPLARIVAPPDEVRRHMDSMFDKMTRAINVFLATRLPRTAESMTEKDDPSAATEQNLIQNSYSPPHTLTPKGA